jgi:hypothetical protein
VAKGAAGEDWLTAASGTERKENIFYHTTKRAGKVNCLSTASFDF